MKIFAAMTEAEIKENLGKLQRFLVQHGHFRASLGEMATEHDMIVVSLEGRLLSPTVEASEGEGLQCIGQILIGL